MIPRTLADVIVPTVGRQSLGALLSSLARSMGQLPGRVLLVDDRRKPKDPLLPDGLPPRLADRVGVLRDRASGPVAARHVGWRASGAEWCSPSKTTSSRTTTGYLNSPRT
jgi:hypothetical protein